MGWIPAAGPTKATSGFSQESRPRNITSFHVVYTKLQYLKSPDRVYMSDPNSTIALAIPQENGTQRKGYGTTSDELKTTLTESSTGSRNILTYFFLILREI